MNLNILFKVVFWRGLTAILSFFTVMLCIKTFSVEIFADYSTAFSIYTACCLIPNLGINNFFVYQNGDKELEEKNYNIKIYYLFFIIIFYVINLFGLIKDLYFYAIIAGILGSMFDYNLVKYQANKEFKKYSFFMPMRTLIFFLCVVLIVLLEKEELIVEDIFKISSFLFLIYYIWTIKGKFNHKIFSFKNNITLYKGAYSFLIYEICVLLMVRAEVWVLSIYTNWGLSKVDVANYWAAFNFILIVSILGNTLANIILPYLKNESEEGIVLLDKMVRKVSLMMLVILVLTLLFVYYISDIFFDDNYSNLTGYVACLGLGVFLGFLSNIERLKLIKMKNKIIDRLVISQLFVSIFLNFTLIYFFDIWGAIIAYVIVRLFGYLVFKYFLSFKMISS